MVLFCVYLRKYMCSASELGVRRYCGLLPPLITLALLLPWRRLRCLSIFQCSSSAGGGRRKLESRSLATTNRLTSNTDEHPSMASGQIIPKLPPCWRFPLAPLLAAWSFIYLLLLSSSSSSTCSSSSSSSADGGSSSSSSSADGGSGSSSSDTVVVEVEGGVVLEVSAMSTMSTTF